MGCTHVRGMNKWLHLMQFQSLIKGGDVLALKQVEDQPDETNQHVIPVESREQQAETRI